MKIAIAIAIVIVMSLVILTSNAFAFIISTEPENIATLTIEASSVEACQSEVLNIEKKLKDQNKIILDRVNCDAVEGSNRSQFMGHVKVYKY